MIAMRSSRVKLRPLILVEVNKRLARYDLIETINLPFVSSSRYELIASGPACVSTFCCEERSLAGKYRMDRKLVVVAGPSAKAASAACRSLSATAIALLVVPKSRPMTGSITCYPASPELRSHSNAEEYARVAGQDRCFARTSFNCDHRRACRRASLTTDRGPR